NLILQRFQPRLPARRAFRGSPLLRRRTRIVDALQARASRLTATRLPFALQDVRTQRLPELTSPRRRRLFIRPCCPIPGSPPSSTSGRTRRYASNERGSKDVA